MKKFIVYILIPMSYIQCEWLPERLVSIQGLRWVTLEDKASLDHKVIVGKEKNFPLALCRGKYSGPFGVKTGRYPGKLAKDGKCYISWEGRLEAIRSQRDVLVLINTDPVNLLLTWIPYKGTIPSNAIVGGTERKRKKPERLLYVCRAHDSKGTHVGYVADENCEIAYKGSTMKSEEFEILTLESNHADIPNPITWVKNLADLQ